MTTRDDTPFWNRLRTMELPASLARKLDLWRGKGRLFREGYELFTNPSWVAVCLGQGLTPATWEPAADALDGLRRGYADTAARLPSHGEFLRMTAPSPLSGWAPDRGVL